MHIHVGNRGKPGCIDLGPNTKPSQKEEFTGWWFGTFGLFFHIFGNHHPN
jgi:hypothetical protein